MRFSDTDKMLSHMYESKRIEPGKNQITGEAYFCILELINSLEKETISAMLNEIGPSRLTREKQILNLIRQGLGYGRIRFLLGLSKEYYEQIMMRIYRKTNAEVQYQKGRNKFKLLQEYVLKQKGTHNG